MYCAGQPPFCEELVGCRVHCKLVPVQGTYSVT